MFIRTILVATDFSERSRHALRYGVELARALWAQVELVHVVSPPGRTDVARRRLREGLAAVPHDGVRVTPRVEVGEPAPVLVRLVADLPADFVVLGTRARRGVTALILGSVAQAVLTEATCPVVTLRADEVPLERDAPAHM
jgi:nucleotide-binding universal stress UspA family protein